MATAEQYEDALTRAERKGFKNLGRIDQDLIRRLEREHGPRGNRARKVLDAK